MVFNKVLLLFCITITVTLVSATRLTKEIDLAEAQERAVNIFETSQQALRNVAGVLSRSDKPAVSEVLDAFNAGFGTDLLVAKDGYVRVDFGGFETILTDNARALARLTYPDNYYQQVVAVGAFQVKISQVKRQVLPVLDLVRIPIQEFEASLSSKDSVYGRVAIQQRDLVSDLISTVQTTVCETFVALIYNEVNSTLTTYITFLDDVNIPVTDENDVVEIVVADVIKVVSNLVSDLVAAVNSALSTLSKGICEIALSASNSTNSTTTSR